MDKKVYDRTMKYHKNHWWFCSRRYIFYHLLKKQSLKKNIKILDYGSGIGANFEILKHFSRNISIYDSDKKILKYTLKIENFKKFNKKEKYDLIILTDVLEHIKYPKKTFKNLLNNLNSGGKFLVTVPAYKFLYSSKDKELHHFRRYNFTTILKDISNKKIVILKKSYFNTILFIPLSFLIIFFKIFKIDFGAASEKQPNWLVNYILKKLFSFERYCLERFNFPFGLSILLIGKKVN